MSFEAVPMQMVASNTAGAIFRDMEIKGKELGVVEANVKYAGADFMAHDAVVHKKLQQHGCEGGERSSESEPALEEMDELVARMDSATFSEKV